LLADDDDDHRQFVALALVKRLGPIDFDSVGDGYDAYGAACERTPDLAILDIDMPGLDGVQLAIALRSRPGLERMPIIVLSGRLGALEQDLLERAGVQRCFSKPLPPSALARAVRELLGTSFEAPTGRIPRRPRRDTLDETG
jgi:two-component system response regulator DesR